MRRTIVAILVSMVALAGHAQTASVTGRVLADATGAPLPNVRVVLAGPAAGSPVLTDGDGRFTLPGPAGRQSVIASKSGYARSEPVVGNAGQPIEIRLQRGATISGRVVDRFGEAVAALRVAAQTAGTDPANPTTVASAETDDAGEYRIAGLPAGKFLVAVNNIRSVTTPRVVAGMQGFATMPELVRTYYPGAATSGEGEQLDVKAGEERSDIDFVVADEHVVGNPYSVKRVVMGLPPPPPAGTVATATVRGRVLSTDGHSLPHADVSLIASSRPLLSRGSATDADGAFEFT